MEVSVIGTGYVGLVTAVCLAEKGHTVVGVDGDTAKVAGLSQGQPTCYEPGVEELLLRNLKNGRLRFTSDLAEAVAASTVLFICVGTPPTAEGRADLSQVEGVARAVAERMDGYRLLVEKSTVPVRTAGWVDRTVRLYGPQGIEFDVASNPEFTREGSAVQDFMHPDRVVIGADTERAAQLLLELYHRFDCPKLVTDVSTAEIIKHASNSFLAMKISYINLMADLCEQTGADVRVVAEGMGLDARIGRSFLNAGMGYGGSCFPKDVQAFLRIGEDLGVDMSLLEAVHEINERRIDQLLAKLHRALWVLDGKQIAIWGLAFKPSTDDVRGSSPLRLAGRLLDEGCSLRLYDPRAMDKARLELPAGDGVYYADSPEDAVTGAHALVVATEWDVFAQQDLAAVAARMAAPILLDGRQVFDPETARLAGLEYYGVGVGVVPAAPAPFGCRAAPVRQASAAVRPWRASKLTV